MEFQSNHQLDPVSLDSACLPAIDGIDLNDPTSLMEVSNFGMPISDASTRDDVLRDAETRSTNIFVTYDRLRGILERHEPTIQKRWIKKTRTQRQAILLKAWPDMPTTHHPDFEILKRPPGNRVALGDYRSHFIWPYINQEDLLAKPKIMLLLLNSRGRRSPCDFAGVDHDTMRLGRCVKSLIPISLDRYTMILNGINTPSEYGRLVAWDDDADAMNWLITRKQFHPGEGLLVLEAQDRLLDFLLSYCKQILLDIPEEDLTSDAFPLQPEPRLKAESEINGFDSLAATAAEASYRVPAQLDLPHIESLLSARASAAEDHVWALREDPAYFANTLRQMKDHRGEMILDSYSMPHPASTGQAYVPLETYSELRQQARELRALQTKYAANISSLAALPKEYLVAILKFRYYLCQAAEGPLGLLKPCATASPPLRRFFVRQPPTDATSSKVVILPKPGVLRNEVEAELIWTLSVLWEDGELLFFMGMPLIVDELERLLSTQPEARDLISPYIAGLIGDLSILSHCLKQLECYHPWSHGFDHAVESYSEDIKKEYSKWTGGPLAGIM